MVVGKIAEKERKYKLLQEKYRSHYRVYNGVDSKLIDDHGVYSNGWETCGGNY